MNHSAHERRRAGAGRTSSARDRAAQGDRRHSRPRMSPGRSASTRSRATQAERMRARRRRRRRSPLPALTAVLLLALIIGCILLYPRPEPVQEPTLPMRYTAQIEAAAEEFSLEPAYLYAVVMMESSFRPDARSDVGAMGLMQIMPSTGKWIAKKLGVSDSFIPEILDDPAVNVRFGSWYLRFLLNRYNGDMRCASAAYHAGQGTVDKWLDDPALSPDGQTLAVIAYESTDNYVNKVMKYYETYSAMLLQAD